MSKPALTPEDIQVGRTYRGKRRTGAGFWADRTVIWKGRNTLQYDGITVKYGQKYPTVTLDKFIAWASHEVEEGQI